LLHFLPPVDTELTMVIPDPTPTFADVMSIGTAAAAIYMVTTGLGDVLYSLFAKMNRVAKKKTVYPIQNNKKHKTAS